jgi:hypothetical protein
MRFQRYTLLASKVLRWQTMGIRIGRRRRKENTGGRNTVSSNGGTLAVARLLPSAAASDRLMAKLHLWHVSGPYGYLTTVLANIGPRAQDE